jgi:hypothetical protein
MIYSRYIALYKAGLLFDDGPQRYHNGSSSAPTDHEDSTPLPKFRISGSKQNNPKVPEIEVCRG